MDGWYDAHDFEPITNFEVELPDGSIMYAYYDNGHWWLLEGHEKREVRPIRFRFVNVLCQSKPKHLIGYMGDITGFPSEMGDTR